MNHRRQQPHERVGHLEVQVGMGFWASKTLLSAVELELFTSWNQPWRSGARPFELDPNQHAAFAF